MSRNQETTEFVDSKATKEKPKSDSIGIVKKQHEESVDADNSQGRRSHKTAAKPDSGETTPENRQRGTPTEVGCGDSPSQKEKHHKGKQENDGKERSRHPESRDEGTTVETNATKDDAHGRHEHRHKEKLEKDVTKTSKAERDGGAIIKGTPIKEVGRN